MKTVTTAISAICLILLILCLTYVICYLNIQKQASAYEHTLCRLDVVVQDRVAMVIQHTDSLVQVANHKGLDKYLPKNTNMITPDVFSKLKLYNDDLNFSGEYMLMVSRLENAWYDYEAAIELYNKNVSLYNETIAHPIAVYAGFKQKEYKRKELKHE